MINAIIVDDEWVAGQWLSYKLKETNLIEVTHNLQNPHQLMECISNTNTEVVFLDIAMPEVNGLELAEKLSMLESAPEIVFVTAYDHYALEAFRVNALDYILKPIHDNELNRVLKKIIKRLSKSNMKQDLIQTMQLEKFTYAAEGDLKFLTAKSEELFCYMLLINKLKISKWEIIEALWPGKNPEKGESNIRTTVFRVNHSLQKSGLDLRIKATKGYYHFVHISDKQEEIKVQLFPPVDKVKDMGVPLLDVLQKYNFLNFIKEKDYLWAVSLNYLEGEYYKWAMELCLSYRQEEQIYLRGLYYLLEQFPWQEQLISQIMPLLLKIEGKGALNHFYQTQMFLWKELYEIHISESIQKEYKNLMNSSVHAVQ